MQPTPKTPLVQYKYDALNRLVSSAPLTQDVAQRFYQKDRLVTEIQGTLQRSIMQHEDQLLAQQQRQSGKLETGLLATDQQRSVQNVLNANRLNPLAYSPYGHCPLRGGLFSLLGFNGERLDPLTGWYLLGTGYHRPFNPVLGCFICPDSWSPFGQGGLNPYAYCKGDPVNRVDPNGHKGFFRILKFRGFGQSSRMAKANQAFESALKEFPNTAAPQSLQRSSRINSLDFPNANNESIQNLSRFSISSKSSEVSSASSSYVSSTSSRKNSVFEPSGKPAPLPPLPTGVKSKTEWSYPAPDYTTQNIYEVLPNFLYRLERSLEKLSLMLFKEHQILDLLTSPAAREIKNISTIINNIRRH